MEKAPEKPLHLAPCNGCGLCCIVALCAAGESLFGEDHPLPCPALHFSEGRYWCGLLLMEDKAIKIKPKMASVIRSGLGIGQGCDVED